MHRTVDVYGINVDELVAPIVKELLDRGVRTLDSCQGDAGSSALISIELDSLGVFKSLIKSKPSWMSITKDSSKYRRNWVYIQFPHERIDDFVALLRNY